jgi:hypothetical protein
MEQKFKQPILPAKKSLTKTSDGVESFSMKKTSFNSKIIRVLRLLPCGVIQGFFPFLRQVFE